MSATIRRAEPEDADAIAALAAASFPLACPPETRSEDLAAYIEAELTPARFRAHLQDSSRITFIATQAADLLGYLMLGRDMAPSVVTAARPMELCKLYVAAAHHGRGIADALMAEAQRIARAADHDALWLGVFQRNARALAFYRRHGFEVVGEQRFLVGSDPQADYLMACALPVAGAPR